MSSSKFDPAASNARIGATIRIMDGQQVMPRWRALPAISAAVLLALLGLLHRQGRGRLER
ncbi:hypothetical protein ACSHT2_08290 [Bradyrhizobium sp. PUT101]|uniref:hypothetical protein n=1 Tax=Bradyrhizobium sp. PUT101 TaxID=3447427 RepID=UPI003F84934C